MNHFSMEPGVEICEECGHSSPGRSPVTSASTLRDRIRAGIPLDGSLRDLLDASKEADEQKIALIAEEMTRLSHVIAELQELGEEIVGDIRFKNHLLAPIHCLPPEILREIFHLFWTAEKGEESLSGNCHPYKYDFCEHHRYSSIKLSQVCHRFREVALDDSVIWSNIKIELDKESNNSSWRSRNSQLGDWKTSLHWLEIFKERSKQAPLTAQFTGKWNHRDEGHISLLTAVLRLGPQISKLTVPLPMIDCPLVSSMGLPPLEHLSVTYNSSYPSSEGREKKTWMMGSFPIHKLSLVAHSRLLVGMPWADVANMMLNSDEETSADLLEVFSTATRLESFEARMKHSESSPSYNTQISLTALQKLRLNCFSSDWSFHPWDDSPKRIPFFPLFDVLTLPSLTSLYLSIPDSRTDFIGSLVRMAKRSRCSLESLSLINVEPFDLVAVSDLIRLSPHLRSLSLKDCYFESKRDRRPIVTPSLVRSLTHTHDAGHPLAPRLQDLDLVGTFEFEPDLMVEMAKSRKSTLRHLNLTVRELPSDWNLPYDATEKVKASERKRFGQWLESFEDVRDTRIHFNISSCRY